MEQVFDNINDRFGVFHIRDVTPVSRGASRVERCFKHAPLALADEPPLLKLSELAAECPGVPSVALHNHID